MILTCPECASRYFVDDARIGPEGRRVRCASCGHAWREGVAVSPASPPAAEPETEVGEPEDDGVRLRGVRADVSAQIREAAAAKRKTREAAAVGAVWAVLGAGFCVLMLGAAVFRTDVVRLAPATAGAYAFVRMPVNPVGLAVESLQGRPALQNGHEMLTVTGVERNVEAHPRAAAPVRVFVLDRSGRRLASQTAAPVGAIGPGEARPFSLSFVDPPLQAASVQVEFAFDIMAAASKAKRPLTRAVAAPSATLKLRGLAPTPATPPAPAKDATPLPANSPYALPSAATPSQHA